MFFRTPLTGSRIIITGASSGIGRSLVWRLARARAQVVAVSRHRARLEELAEQVQAWGGQPLLTIAADVTDRASREQILSRTLATLGGVDILVNNAGVGATGFFADADEERLRQIFEVNFFGATELTRLALPHLQEGKNPMIVNVASVLGRRAIPGCAEYCASKFAMVGWSEALRAELAPRGIHVLVACPGGVATGFDANMLEKGRRITKPGRRRMTPYRCAQLLVQAMRSRPNEVVITREAKVAIWANRLAPRLVDWILARKASDGC